MLFHWRLEDCLLKWIMADEVVDLPYRAEYAKSGRAACKGCKEKIEKGELRLAVMVQVSKNLDFDFTRKNNFF